MNKTQAESSMPKVASEISRLDPSSLITLYEIDVSEIAKDLTISQSIDIDTSVPFRFHNMNNLKGISLYYKTDQYYSFPITADGFQMNAAGALPTPTLTMTCLEGLESDVSFSIIKKAFLNLENMIGAKVTRIRTFSKFLDSDQSGDTIEGVGGEADPNAELPRDVFYIERKASENKYSIQFELSSIIDLENLQLPGRVIYASRCPWSYRGEGCCYEYKGFLNGPTSGDDQADTFGHSGHLPDFAPPVAGANNKLLSEECTGTDGTSYYNPDTLGRVTGSSIAFKGEYEKNRIYNSGNVVFLEKNNLKYYFVAKTGEFTGVCPPHGTYWQPDQCSKSLEGCKIRWGAAGKARNCSGVACSDTTGTNSFLPFGGFPGTNTKVTTN